CYKVRGREHFDDARVLRYAGRLAGWFRKRHEEADRLSQFESEADQLRFWRDQAVQRDDRLLAAELYWLEAYIPYHRSRDMESARSLLERAMVNIDASNGRDDTLKAWILADLAYAYHATTQNPSAF